MIEYIEGEVRSRWSNGIVVMANGIGYGLEMPVPDLCDATAVAGRMAFWVHTYVREDQLKLFGFTKQGNRDAFRLLLTINGVGPKAGLAILSTVSVDGLYDSVMSGDATALRQAPGIGPKLASRIVLELKGKLDRLALEGGFQQITRPKTEGWDQVDADIRSALTNLGFAERQISFVLREVRQAGVPADGFPRLMKDALARLAGVREVEAVP